MRQQDVTSRMTESPCHTVEEIKHLEQPENVSCMFALSMNICNRAPDLRNIKQTKHVGLPVPVASGLLRPAVLTLRPSPVLQAVRIKADLVWWTHLSQV